LENSKKNSSDINSGGQSLIAYADCFSGLAGDMFLGALISCGLSESVLKEQLDCLDLPGWQLIITQEQINRIDCVRVNVKAAEPQPARNWSEIRKLINNSSLDKRVKSRAEAIFKTLAIAEAKVHNKPVEKVHFHEVGAVDSIIDIVGAAIGIEELGVDFLISSPLPMPRGWVQCAHGRLPVPAPAVCEILKNCSICGSSQDVELLTPTGAAIIKTLNSGFGEYPSMTVKNVGYGAGTRILADNQPNLFRLVLGAAHPVSESQKVVVIETNLDNWSPETFPFLSKKLFNNGALDVSIVPIQMKKGRPGFELRVISPVEISWELQRIILSETSAIGLRYRQENRWTLPRKNLKIKTCLGEIMVKTVKTPDGIRINPEYEECKRIAEEKNISIRKVYSIIEQLNTDDEVKIGW
jgi:pyridinium-3,5-bisthiocarboxylic acid mononucleotide nickel chelatase